MGVRYFHVCLSIGFMWGYLTFGERRFRTFHPAAAMVWQQVGLPSAATFANSWIAWYGWRLVVTDAAIRSSFSQKPHISRGPR